MGAKMYPPRFKSRDNPDVALLFGEDKNVEVAELMPGDWVEFEATMSAHGYRGDPEIMTLWHIRKVQRPDPLSSSAHAGYDTIGDAAAETKSDAGAKNATKSAGSTATASAQDADAKGAGAKGATQVPSDAQAPDASNAS